MNMFLISELKLMLNFLGCLGDNCPDDIMRKRLYLKREIVLNN